MRRVFPIALLAVIAAIAIAGGWWFLSPQPAETAALAPAVQSQPAPPLPAAPPDDNATGGHEPTPDAAAIPVPSGQVMRHADTVQSVEADGTVYRFRFVAPAIAGQGESDATLADMQALCDDYALPRIPEGGPQPSKIVISLSDRPIPFGQSDPKVTQYFEAYRIENGKCVWEYF